MENFYYFFSTYESMQSSPAQLQWSYSADITSLSSEQYIYKGELILLREIATNRKTYALIKKGLIELSNKEGMKGVAFLQLKNTSLRKIKRNGL